MNVYNWVKTGMYVSLIVMFGFGSYFLWTLTQAVKQTLTVTTQAGQSISRTESSVEKASDSVVQVVNGIKPVENNLMTATNSLNTVILAVNRPCGGGESCGTLADVSRTLNTVRGTFGQIEIAAKHEDKNLGAIDDQEVQLFSDTHQALLGVNKATSDIDALFVSHELTGTLNNLNIITGNLGQTTGDFQTKFHSILYPPPCVGKLCFIKKAWPYIKGGSEIMEPLYWGSQLVQSIH